MTLVTQSTDKRYISEFESSEANALHTLYTELKKGIQSMKNGDVYTIEEAWGEIDKI
ncbi:MAG: hypothetical protein IJZ53_02255 [Tyzzerella sp.]|nr:hypothetical protein [Tyzzerella sp.]